VLASCDNVGNSRTGLPALTLAESAAIKCKSFVTGNCLLLITIGWVSFRNYIIAIGRP